VEFDDRVACVRSSWVLALESSFAIDSLIWPVVLFVISNHTCSEHSLQNKNLTRTMSRAAKRRRSGAPRTFGAPSEADEIVNPVNVPSATAFSTRTIRENRLIPLSVICARVFAASFPRMSKDPRQWEPSKKWKAVGAELKNLPDPIVQTLFTTLSSSCPDLLSHDLVKEVHLVLRCHILES
jgi:hypothetical protein